MSRVFGPALLTALIAGAVLVPPTGQALASHVQCGDVITKDTVLDSDLIDCPGDGIVIGADDITLDLNGHTVDGDGDPRGFQGCDTGIVNGRWDDCTVPPEPGHDNVTVRDGTVREFALGVQLQKVNRNALLRLRISGSRGPGMFVDMLSDGLIRENIVTGGHGDGILLAESGATGVEDNVLSGNAGHGIELTSTVLGRIERNVTSHNGADGIFGSGTSTTLVHRNLVIENGGAGMDISDGTFDNRFEANRVSDNGSAGILLGEGAHRNRLEGNSVFRNGRRFGPQSSFVGGIVIAEGHGNRIRKNHISANGGRGGIVLSESSSENVIDSNLLAGNSADGILLEDAAADNNLIEANRATRNGEDGIGIGGDTAGNAARGNLVNRNGDDGIDVESPLTTIEANIANRNRDLGIEAVSGVTDAGGNKAAHNGNPSQCLNVSCKAGAGQIQEVGRRVPSVGFVR
jgi:parallel beta-helix repeat protein